MKLKFTRNFSFMVCLMFGWASMSAQPNTLTISSPASVANDYAIGNAAFGGVIPEGMPITIQLLNDNDDSDSDTTQDPGGNTADGCNGTINPLNGNWAFMDRGDCQFGTKALAAEAAGAAGVIICNWEANGPALVGMPPGDDGANVTIPVASLSTADCAALKAVITETEFATGTFALITGPCPPPDYPASTVWGSDGEGTFDGGLGEWTTESSSGVAEDLWQWEADAAANGAFGGADKLLPSITNCNGAALMDFDFLTTSVNPNPTQPYPVHSAYLISPVMNLETAEFPVLNFTHRYNHLNEDVTISFSRDGGITFGDPYLVPRQIETNEFDQFLMVDHQAAIPMNELAFAQEAVVRFEAVGDFYYWLVDDVYVTSETITDVQANDFYSGATNWRTPVPHVEEIAFVMDIENIGNSPVTNSKVLVEVFDNDNLVVVHTDELAYGDIAGGFLAENEVFAAAFDIPANIGSYTINYTFEADNDSNPDNNFKSRPFEITETEFAKCPAEDEGGNLGGVFFPGNPYMSIGNVYHVVDATNLYVDKVRFGISNDAPGGDVFSGFINFKMYKWLDLNEDQLCDPNERALVGSLDQVIASSFGISYRDMEVIFNAADGSPDIKLEDNTTYVITANMNSNNADDDGEYFFLTNSQSEYNHGGMSLARDSLGLDPRYGSIVAFGADGTEADVEARILEPWTARTVWMPMSTKIISGTEDINTDVSVTAFPNPASDQLFVDVALEEVSEQVVVELITIDGKLASSQKFSFVKNQELEVNISNMANGLYIMNVRTDAGINTQKILIEK